MWVAGETRLKAKHLVGDAKPLIHVIRASGCHWRMCGGGQRANAELKETPLIKAQSNIT